MFQQGMEIFNKKKVPTAKPFTDDTVEIIRQKRVDRARIELATHGFSGRCSTN
jgi:hypothetical protein